MSVEEVYGQCTQRSIPSCLAEGNGIKLPSVECIREEPFDGLWVLEFARHCRSRAGTCARFTLSYLLGTFAVEAKSSSVFPSRLTRRKALSALCVRNGSSPSQSQIAHNASDATRIITLSTLTLAPQLRRFLEILPSLIIRHDSVVHQRCRRRNSEEHFVEWQHEQVKETHLRLRSTRLTAVAEKGRWVQSKGLFTVALRKRFLLQSEDPLDVQVPCGGQVAKIGALQDHLQDQINVL
mmetsp:Transcript_26688/g.70053  ORF Transcript_26688/g.70053 Transcript_26688/m.70053 type:complete len:238 (+) Transcript_26688:1269-1982(+)